MAYRINVYAFAQIGPGTNCSAIFWGNLGVSEQSRNLAAIVGEKKKYSAIEDYIQTSVILQYNSY